MVKCNQYFKNSHNTKITHKNITDAPNRDAKIASDDDYADAPNTADDYSWSTDFKKIPYLLRNCNYDLNADNYDSASPYYAASPDSLIDFKLKRKIDPSSMIKLKK